MASRAALALLLGTTALVLTGSGRPCAADDAPGAPRAIVVVDVAPDARAIDPAALRSDVGRELSAAAVTPDDPRAAHATGTLRVQVDPAGHILVVSYQPAASSAPITRSVELPSDPAATEHAVVLLAGNLARDEADQLAADLRESREPAPKTPTEIAESVEDARRLARLGEALDREQQRNQTRRSLSLGFILGATGAAAASIGFTVDEVSSHASWAGNAAFLSLSAWEGLAFCSALVAPGDFDALTATLARGRAAGESGLAAEETEQAWLKAARHERSRRLVLGWLITIPSGLTVALGGVAIGYVATHPSSGIDVAEAAAVTAMPAVGTVAGLWMLTGDGPIESALHDYEAADGHTIRSHPSTALALHPVLSPSGTGWIAGVGGTF